MKRFLAAAFLGLLTLSLGSGKASAWWPFGKCCFSCKKTCCYQYNAFSPYCCYLPPGHHSAGYANGHGPADCHQDGHCSGFDGLLYRGHDGHPHGHSVILDGTPTEQILAPSSSNPETKSTGKDTQSALPQSTIPQGAIPQGNIQPGIINQGTISSGFGGQQPNLPRFQGGFAPTNRGGSAPGAYWRGNGDTTIGR